MIEHCPTEAMLADFFTKPLQGSLFRKFRSVLLGHDHISSLRDPGPSHTEERVGTCDSVTEQRSVRRTVPLDADAPQTQEIGAAV